MTGTAVPRTTMSRLIEGYEGLLLDAYGVLLTHEGPLPGAVDLIRCLNRTRKPYLILTNDASRSPEASALRYREMGLPIDDDRVITSGSVLSAHFARTGLAGSRFVVLGTEDSQGYVTAAGGTVVTPRAEMDADGLVVCDERGFPLREYLDHVLSWLYRKTDAMEPVSLVLANPDLVYPAGSRSFGFTAGAVALLLERALSLRYPEREDLGFVPLGKPHAPMFEEAFARLGTRNLVMVGDQLDTDILGARNAGLDSAWIGTGVGRNSLLPEEHRRPTFILDSLII